MGEKDRLKKVFFLKDTSKIYDVLDELVLDDYSGKETLVKLHMGETGNRYFPKTDFVRLIVDALKRKSAYPFLYDTTVMYNSKRRYLDGYKEVAKNHGFTVDNIGCNVRIDERGKPVEIEGETYFVGNEMYNAENIVGISHFKGHIASGMGGAIKNFGMGGVTRESKKFMHNGCKPVYNEDKCVLCGLCSQLCPFNAIKIIDNNWNIDIDTCFGCGVCINNCEYDALNYVNNDLSFFLACAAKACIDGKKVIYVNDVNRISRSCDCDPESGPIICPDIGYLVSDDPVAIDKASLDLINDIKPNVFEKVNRVNPFKQIEYGEEIGIGSSKYRLIEL